MNLDPHTLAESVAVGDQLPGRPGVGHHIRDQLARQQPRVLHRVRRCLAQAILHRHGPTHDETEPGGFDLPDDGLQLFTEVELHDPDEATAATQLEPT